MKPQYHTIASAARYLYYHKNTVFHAVHIAKTLEPDAWAGDDRHRAPLFLKETLDAFARQPSRPRGLAAKKRGILS